ncbi:Uma2 family endonuclease [Streptomyces sp. NBC_01481]|uniref:Uma2 family endonuclease n=1 Tax=Streptomyces sp. NBC_01481 TaxID=2975869 RepID=UPI002254679B|nr:Uma2 family endonuclease [Streptomyces sp. NBC_01481]MCX4584493.1 Uma2 family endonuclease [Streptomyces sp. NBC_01481]
MTAALVEPELSEEDMPSWDYLLSTWQELDVPEGWRAEIDEGLITLVPPPDDGHNLIAEQVHWALRNAAPEGWGVYQTLGLFIYRLERLYIPDLVVVPKKLLAERAKKKEKAPLAAAEAALAVEITSKSNASHDRSSKLSAYASGAVPLYLLIDRYDEGGPSVTLFSEPRNGMYRTGLRKPFGEPVPLPEPFSTELDTSEFIA